MEPSIDMLDKLAAYYGLTIDQVVHYKKGVLKAAHIEDKTTAEQLRLLSLLNDKDKNVVMSIIDTMLTKQKFQEFFQQNIAAAK